MHALDNNMSGIYIVQGEGGSGKSTMAKIITAYARSKCNYI
jgi:ABC-type molybdenum transport system ATPase subunit/photorepair protein PhrA